jgi:hypothetical protein
MPTFLHSLLVRTLSQNSILALTETRLRLTPHCRHAFVVPLLLFAFTSNTDAWAMSRQGQLSLMTAASSLSKPIRKRVVALRRNDSPDGLRFTLTSDAPLDDYRSYAEGERLCVMIPQATLISTRHEESGQAFADMRVEERDGDFLLSFRLQSGATVAVNQSFNRLDVVFIMNERANQAD